ncbi:hypothetical protein SEVIR_1G156100v4 [Setaria viridis]|uniref:Isopenicillin N synthase-like Fe(2+) 2OG dioxygenase domain-containing protein n=2 Tax=Setaria TaxID=4554 RepID=A0A368PKQ2_SETIT|nr:uncharacterized protein LOC101764093 isoform X2 [Setaria italica]XP_034588296.1 uncharacterized protein LOC117850538 isoform X2 [Setaria viridis]RCV06335.1 hypothetical protein SETIT_1G154800v2 [Setaria italica]TKW39092.1 hypothetical protein SEVIR_1G156100v2 [Setaria viridis]
MAKTAAATVLDIAELPFSDLVLLQSPETLDDDRRRRRILDTVATELGRGGSGLLAIAEVPRVGAIRRRLLPLSRRLALMDHPTRSQLLKKHGLGSDVPLKKLDRSVSSFTKLLRHSGELALVELVNNTESMNNGFVCLEKIHNFDGSEEANGDDDMENLGELVKELGLYMIELGILIARACDIVIGGGQLEQSITDFGTAKARLIHYHSELDNIIIREKENSIKKKCSLKKVAVKPYQLGSQRSGSPCPCCIKSEEGTPKMAIKDNDPRDTSVQGQATEISLLNLWQEWHYDFGILTVLTAPLFLSGSEGEKCLVNQEYHHPDGHTHLQLCNGRKIFSVRCSPESFIVQVGEAADILSRGKLKSTLHSILKSNPVVIMRLRSPVMDQQALVMKMYVCKKFWKKFPLYHQG